MTLQNKTINNPLSGLSKWAWSYYMSFFKGMYGKITRTTLVAAGQTLIIIPSLLLVKYAFDVVIPDDNIKLLVTIGVVIFLLRMVNSLISIALRRSHIRIINRAVYAMRENLLNKLYNFSYLFYANSDLRTLHTRIVQDTERVVNMSSALISRLLPSVIISFGLLIVCFILNWYLLLIIISLFPLLILANRLMGQRIKKRVFVFQRAFEEFSKGIYFVLRYMSLTTIQSAQDAEMKRQRAVLNDLQIKTGRMADLFSVNLQLQESLTGLTAIIIIITGGISVALKSMSLGDFLSFYLAAMYLNKYVNTITSSVPDIIAGNVSLNTLYDLASTEDNHKYQGKNPIEFTGEVKLRSIHFSYGDNNVLKGTDLHINPHERVAVIGPNGSGKTTIMNLITGLLVPDEGDVFASGYSFLTIDMTSFRKQIGVVQQHPPLFPGTVAENIVYGSESVDMEQLQRVSELALAHDFISRLPDSYNTNIGDDGILLSGGEGQRIAIARALYRNPSLLILDEPTNHLDNSAIAGILENLRTINPAPSILIISHDRGVIGFADKVFEMHEGILK